MRLMVHCGEILSETTTCDNMDDKEKTEASCPSPPGDRRKTAVEDKRLCDSGWEGAVQGKRLQWVRVVLGKACFGHTVKCPDVLVISCCLAKIVRKMTQMPQKNDLNLKSRGLHGRGGTLVSNLYF